MKQLPFIVSEQWPEQYFQGEGYSFKTEGQMVKIIWQCTGFMYWPKQDLDHNFKDNGQNDSTVQKFHVRLICPKNMKQLSL